MTKLTLDNSGLANEAGTLTIYNYDAQSGELINTFEEYFPQGVGLPANATIIAPPTVKKNHVAVYREGGWQVIADHRGETVYAITNGTSQEVTETIDYPAGTTTLKPATEFDKWDGENWVTDKDAMSAAQVKDAEARRKALLAEAQVTISIWQTELQLGIIDNEDKAKLTDWLSYIKALQKIDSSAAPDIEWPEVSAQ